jgi:hypothetical protein
MGTLLAFLLVALALRIWRDDCAGMDGDKWGPDSHSDD